MEPLSTAQPPLSTPDRPGVPIAAEAEAELADRAPHRRRRGPRPGMQNGAGYAFMTPWLVGFSVLTLGPLLVSLYLAFTDFNLLQPPTWVGLDNITEMMRDRRLHNSLVVTFVYVAVSVPVQLAFALFVAVILNRATRGIGWYRAMFYVPSLLGSSVAIAVVWMQLFSSDGVINQFLGLFGIDGPSWIASPDTALSTLIILSVWQFGAPMVIFLAALKQVPQELLDASAVDGANAWQRFRSITLPVLSPVVFFNLVLQVIQAFQAFTPAYVISNGTGGPSDSTMFYTLYLYLKGFRDLDMGYASAMAWLLLVIIAVFTAINFLASRYWVHYDD